jgi:ribonuclease HI
MFKRSPANRPVGNRHADNREGGLFADAGPESNAANAPTATTAAYRANIDGGSRGNPGPASYGVVIRDPRGQVVAKLKKYIGRTTNNVAEYYGLIAALDYAQQHGIRALRIESDSELLVRQMRGEYKVKSPELRPLYERARKMAQTFDSFKIDHVYREQNAEADALANEALDETSGRPAAPKLDATSTKPQPPPRKIRARFRNGAFVPLDPLDLAEGSEVEITFRPIVKT